MLTLVTLLIVAEVPSPGAALLAQLPPGEPPGVEMPAEATEPAPQHRRMGKTADEWLYESPTLDGHGRGYYVAWGIVDWAVAGNMWLGSAGCAIAGLVFAIAGYGDAGAKGRFFDQISDGRDDGAVDQTGLRSLAIGYGITGAVLGIGGGILASRAQENLDSAALLRGWARDMREASGEAEREREEREERAAARDAAKEKKRHKHGSCTCEDER
jgi:hypothetical protein